MGHFPTADLATCIFVLEAALTFHDTYMETWQAWDIPTACVLVCDLLITLLPVYGVNEFGGDCWTRE